MDVLSRSRGVFASIYGFNLSVQERLGPLEGHPFLTVGSGRGTPRGCPRINLLITCGTVFELRKSDAQ